MKRKGVKYFVILIAIPFLIYSLPSHNLLYVFPPKFNQELQVAFLIQNVGLATILMNTNLKSKIINMVKTNCIVIGNLIKK